MFSQWLVHNKSSINFIQFYYYLMDIQHLLPVLLLLLAPSIPFISVATTNSFYTVFKFPIHFHSFRLNKILSLYLNKNKDMMCPDFAITSFQITCISIHLYHFLRFLRINCHLCHHERFLNFCVSFLAINNDTKLNNGSKTLNQMYGTQ